MKRQWLIQQLLQFGILIAALGAIFSLIGLFPGVTGIDPQTGTGILQIVMIIAGVWLIIVGELVLVKVVFYPRQSSNLSQSIAIRLSFTALLFLGAVGMSDVLGYGSNPPEGDFSYPIMGVFQASGIVLGFVMASIGVLLFVITGTPNRPQTEEVEDFRSYVRKTQEHYALGRGESVGTESTT